MLMIDENHFKAMIGKYVPVERIGDFKKELISQTFSDDEIEIFKDLVKTERSYGATWDEKTCEELIEKLKRRGPSS